MDNTNRGLDNSRYHAKTEFNNCFIMYSKPKNKEQYKWNTRKFHANLIRTKFFSCSLDEAMFLKQSNDSNQTFKLMKIAFKFLGALAQIVFFDFFCSVPYS